MLSQNDKEIVVPRILLLPPLGTNLKLGLPKNKGSKVLKLCLYIWWSVGAPPQPMVYPPVVLVGVVGVVVEVEVVEVLAVVVAALLLRIVVVVVRRST